jgi:hypothetical protein
LSGIKIDNQVKDDGLDEAVRRITDEEGECLTGKNQGISAAGNRKGKDKGKGKGKGVVFANSHNDEMQKEPWVSQIRYILPLRPSKEREEPEKSDRALSSHVTIITIINDNGPVRQLQDLAYNLGLASMEADTWLVRPSWLEHRPDANSSSSRSKVPPPEAPLFDTTISNGGLQEEPRLYVGHTPIDLRKDRTLKVVYLDRIWEILERVNEGRHRGSEMTTTAGSGERGQETKEGNTKGDGEEKLGGKKEGNKAGKKEEDKRSKRGVVGEKGWDWNGVYTDRGAKDQTLLFYIDVVSRSTPSSLGLDFQMERKLITKYDHYPCW